MYLKVFDGSKELILNEIVVCFVKGKTKVRLSSEE